MTSDLAKSSTAVASVFEILDRQSLIPKVLYPKLNIIATKLHTWSFEFGFFHIDP
jgi:ATP-binding cassette subfamily B (MDR/TAP) protein 1